MNVPHQAQSLILTPMPPRTVPLLAVAGGKGGVGKTLLAVNLAILAQRAGYRTLLVDLDPGLANIDVHLRLSPSLTLEELAQDLCRPRDAMLAGPADITVLPGRSGSSWLAAGDADSVQKIHAAVKRAAQGFDLVIADCGAGIGPLALGTVACAALTLAVTTPDPAAVTDAYAFAKLVTMRGSPLPRLAVNGCRSKEEGMRTATRLAAVSERFLGRKLELSGTVRRDAQLERSVLVQRPFAAYGSGPALEDLQALSASTLSLLPLRTRARAGAASA